MTIDKIEELLENNLQVTVNEEVSNQSIKYSAKEIYKLHLEDKIELLKTLKSDPDYLLTAMFDIELNELEQKLKTLEE